MNFNRRILILTNMIKTADLLSVILSHVGLLSSCTPMTHWGVWYMSTDCCVCIRRDNLAVNCPILLKISHASARGGGVVALSVGHRTCDLSVAGSSPASAPLRSGFRASYLHLCASVTKQYK